MSELPLFPLNTVLFPGSRLRLKIFEPHYHHIIRYCVNTGEPLGGVLFKQGLDSRGLLPEPYRIGCAGEITEVQRLRMGQMLITVVGQERFRIHSLDYSSEPYLLGNIELFPLVHSSPDSIYKHGESLLRWVKDYQYWAGSPVLKNLGRDYLPKNPVTLAYQVAAAINIPTRVKQDLLSIRHVTDFLEVLTQLCRREVTLLKIQHHEPLGQPSIFSIN